MRRRENRSIERKKRLSDDDQVHPLQQEKRGTFKMVSKKGEWPVSRQLLRVVAGKGGDRLRRGTTRAEDDLGTPTQSHISPSILVYAH